MAENVEVAIENQNVEVLHKTISQNRTTRLTGQSPADGGARAWLVMMGSFFCNGILFGIINSYGMVYTEFHDNFQRNNVTNAPGKAALVGSLAMGTTFFISPVSGILTDYLGIRKTTLLGGAIASGGLFLSSFCMDNIAGLCITYGIMYGFGGALAYTPSLVILGHYFKKYLGIVNGIVTAGSSVFTVVMPYVIEAFLKSCGIVWTLRLLALFAAFIMACAVLFKPDKVKSSVRTKIKCSDLFNVGVIRNIKYLIWTIAVSISLFGYFVPYVYMLDFVKEHFPSNADKKLPVMCIGISSGLGRLIFGYLADQPGVNRIFLQQLAFFCIGILTMLLPVTVGYFSWLIIVCLGIGLFDGCFVGLLGPIAFDICDKTAATQAIGFLLGLCSIPMTIGPYVAGIILDRTHNYTIPFILAGFPPIMGTVAMFLTRCFRDKNGRDKAAQQPLNREKIENTNRLLAKTGVSKLCIVCKNVKKCHKRCYSYSVL